MEVTGLGRKPYWGKFYSDVVNTINQLITTQLHYTNTDIILHFLRPTKKFYNTDYPKIANLIHFKEQREGENYEYTINLYKIEHFNFKSEEFLNLGRMRYEEYCKMLDITYDVKSFIILVLLHEIGHMDQFQQFRKHTNALNKEDRMYRYHDLEEFGIYMDSVLTSWSLLFTPHRYKSDIATLNLLANIFTPFEGYAEAFSYKYFPYFIPLLKKYETKEEDKNE